MPIRRLDKTYTATTATIAGEEIAANVIPVKPHIQPGTLQPAVAGKDLSGTALGGSYVYGTAHTDGHKYYYTDIKGSKPIKDPRIGAYFGSQRHKFKSMQLLEQETATHGDEVSSVDGREWIRRVGKFTVTDGYGAQGHFAGHTASGDTTNSKYFEIVGYFNAANYLSYGATNRDVNVFIDGTQNPSSTVTAGTSTIDTPLRDRYVDASSVINIPITGLTTPGIHTLKIANVNGDYLLLFGIELIAQDTGSTARKSQINIPAQNVVSYGKKFSIGSDTLTNAVHKHYNPFAFKTDGSTAWASGAHNGTSWPVGTGSSTNIDTATSLGLENWKHGDNYYYPYNGGRVVKWIASDGTIKTSVNVVPPNAQNISTSAISAKANASVANNTYLPTFEAGTLDKSLSEVAKSFFFQEFGNGAANGGTGGTYPDASMLHPSTRDDIAYCMDDGLTSLTCDDGAGDATARFLNIGDGNDESAHITFIGTGITYRGGHTGDPGPFEVAMNLPYGTHILKITRDTDASDTGKIDIDGVEIWDQPSGRYGMRYPAEFSFYQPKMPPIPEDAVVIADYMLMADFVPRTANGIKYISKGVRYMNPTRDYHYNYSGSAGSSSGGWVPVVSYRAGFSRWDRNHNSDSVRTVTCFGNSFDYQYYTDSSGVTSTTLTGGSAGTTNMSNHTLAGAGAGFTSVTSAGVITKAQSGSEMDNYVTGVAGASAPIGVQVFKETSNINSMTNYATSWAVHTPIHTSSHYQSFETPFLHELVGGDRNMEQTNLVVSPSGQTWDQLRDTSYLGKMSLQMTTDTHHGGDVPIIMDEWRGMAVYSGADTRPMFNKDFAIAYDRYICLRDGQYLLYAHSHSDSTNDYLKWYLNGHYLNMGYTNLNDTSISTSVIANLVKGDYIYLQGVHGEHWNIGHSSYITRIS